MTDAFHIVTNKDVWDELQLLNGNLNGAVAAMREVTITQDVQGKTLAEHEERLHSLDMKYYGVLAGLIMAGGYLIVNGGIVG